MSTREEMCCAELIDALKIVESSDSRHHEIMSSWAGALGQPRFMPLSYLKMLWISMTTATIIWNSVPDALVSYYKLSFPEGLVSES